MVLTWKNCNYKHFRAGGGLGHLPPKRTFGSTAPHSSRSATGKKNSSRKRTNKLVFKRSTRSSKSCYSWTNQEKPKGWKGSKRTKVLGNNVDVSKHIFRLPSASGDRGPEVFMIIDYWLHAWTVSFGSLVSTHHNSQLGAPFVKSKAQSNPRGSRPKRAPSRYVRLRSPWERKDR